MRCLVTGASGFIGSAVLPHLMRRGHKVEILLRPGQRTERLKHCLQEVRVVHGDLSNTESLRRAIQGQIDAVIHLAWFGVAAEVRNCPEQISRNLVGAMTVWEAARTAGCQIWVGLGSQAEYGPYMGVLHEDMPPRPVTAYGVAKLAECFATAKMSELAGIRHVWLRLLSAYGPGDDERHLLPSVILNLLEGHEPKLTRGEQIWDYLYVEDAAEAICTVLDQDVTGVFNLGSGSTSTIRNIVEQVRDMIDPSLSIGFGEVPYRNDQVMHLEADITRLITATDWRPRVSLESGLKQTIHWYRQRKAHAAGH